MPAKFDGWRSGQVEALQFLLTSKKRIKALSMPTGAGKSAVYVGWALITKEPTCFVTDNRALQDQLMDDFKPVGMVDIRGRRNYPCDLKPDSTCEEGYASRCPYKGTVGCPSSQAEMRAATSRLVVTNYDKWTAAKKYGQGMNHFTQVVFDEGHEAPNALARAMQVVLHQREIEQTLGLDWPRWTEDFSGWKEWAIDAKEVAAAAFDMALERLKGVGDPPQAWVRHMLHMKQLTRRLGTLASARAADWVTEEIDRAFVFDPIRPGRYAEPALLLRVPNIVVVSATLRPKTLYLMGVGQDNFDFKEFPSDFDPKRCPIYWVPTMRVDSKPESDGMPKDLSKLWMRLDQIAARRRDRKGIVHTISYARRDAIITQSRFAPSMLINQQGAASTEIVGLFKASKPGTILVSPSVGAGFDFPGPQCEFQFVCKVPFPPPSKILKARTADDKEYPYYLAMQELVQMFGRGMRSRDDRCENFIADDHVEWFLNRYGHLAPKSFHGFFKRVEVLPQPPPAL